MTLIALLARTFIFAICDFEPFPEGSVESLVYFYSQVTTSQRRSLEILFIIAWLPGQKLLDHFGKKNG